MAIRLFGGAGYTVFDVALATGGKVSPDVVYNYGLPAVPGTEGLADHLARLYGVDLFYQQGDFLLQGNGDLALTTGLGAFRASFARALATPPGDIYWRPNYGVGLVEFLNLPATAANFHEMKNRIQQTLGSDPAVEEITRNEVTLSRNVTGLIQVFVDVVVGGQPTSLSLEIRSTV
jgi:phage baseplate assembly protein W